MGGCSVFVTPKVFFIFTNHESVFGYGIKDEPSFKIDRDTDLTEVGNLILTSISASRKGVDPTGRIKALTAKTLEFTGYRSWRALEKDSIVIGVTADGNKVTLTPTLAAPGGGSLYKPDRALVCPVDAGEIGKDLLRLLAQ